MTSLTNFKKIKHEGFDVQINIIESHEGATLFSELYTESEHQGGVSIQVPGYLRSSVGIHKHYRGQYSPAELASDYAKLGVENPSREAYKNLQDELGMYLTADTCWLEYVWSVKGVELVTSFGCCFNYSHEYSKNSLEEEADYIYSEEVVQELEEGFEEANVQLQEFVSAITALPKLNQSSASLIGE
jgi:hypothetical protein